MSLALQVLALALLHVCSAADGAQQTLASESLQPVQAQQAQRLGALVLSGLLREPQESRYAAGKRYPEESGRYEEDSPELEGRRQQQHLSKKKREAARKRWHKLLDDLIDGADKTGAELDGRGKRLQWAPPTGPSAADDATMILMKRPPSEEQADRPPVEQSLELPADGLKQLLKQWEPARQRPADEHSRRVLDDKFGIVRESIFTTNNHLGNKGVPKFGSEEEY